MVRLTARLWVDAYLTQLRLFEVPAFVVAHGDDTAGSILVKLNTLDGNANLFRREFDMGSGQQVWTEFMSGTDADLDIAIEKQRGFDPDLWVIEVEDTKGRHLLDMPGFS